MHIGLIGGIGPAATVFYYQRIVRAFAALAQPLHLTVAHTGVQTLAKNAAADQREAQAAEYNRVAQQLAAAGADIVAITSMGGHFCVKEFAALSPLPMINGPDAVAAQVAKQGITRIGILGTRVVMQTALYGTLRGFDPVIPGDDALFQVDQAYVAIAKAGVASSEHRKLLLEAGQHLVRDQGAQALLLGGTDLNLVYRAGVVDFPVIDSAAVHCDAIVARCFASSRA